MIFDRSTFTTEFYGYVPAPLVVSGKFLRDDGTWQTAGGGGGGSLAIKEEGVTLTTAATEINFVGSAFTAAAIGNAVTLTADPDIVYGDAANTWSSTQTFSATTAIVLDWGTGFNYEFEQTANGFAFRETASNNFALEFNESTSVGLLRASDGLQSAEYRFNGDTGQHEFYSNGNLALSFNDTVFTPTARISFSKIQTISTARILGRTTAGSGDVEQISIGAGLSLSGGSLSSTITQYTDEMAQDAVGTMVGTSLIYNDAGPTLQRAALTGDVTASQDSNSTTIANNAVTTVKIADNNVTLAKLVDIATASFLGRTTAGSGDPEVLTATQATALLNTFTSLLKGLVPASGGGTTNFLRADGTWAAPPGGGGGGLSDVDVLARAFMRC